jgi:hypothetical protein
MRLLKRLFARLQEIETGGEGGAAGGGGVDTAAASVADATGQAADSGAGAGAVTSANEPKSMLEAIEQGLKGPTDADGKTAAERARDEQGRFAKQDPAAVTKPAEVKPADAAAKAIETPAADDLAMPEGLSPKAQERFQTLVTRVKEREQALEAVQSDVQAFRSIIQESRATPEEFSQAMDYMRMVKTGNLEQALQVLDMQRQQIALALGKPLPASDPLADFPDLRQAVENYQVDEAHAIKLARARVQEQAQQRSYQQAQQTQQQQQTAQVARSGAIQQIDQLGANWAKTDPDFAAKEDIILKQLPEIAAKFPPNMWAQQVTILYNALSAMPRPVAPRQNPAPLRSSGQSAGARQPSNMLEALQAGLGYSNG